MAIVPKHIHNLAMLSLGASDVTTWRQVKTQSHLATWAAYKASKWAWLAGVTQRRAAAVALRTMEGSRRPGADGAT
ncbi:jg9912 [Pararge aegeria aegeria]|uniref:Jg9912 protein n=1 Tax=Pararge aegeria aegeria TaxID=348720 RepID=A0A8S4RB08_9NEOP|nr:jg9912 [Pararge aegeria aegeria]